MSFPILKEVYEYNNKKYTLLAQTLFYKVYIVENLQKLSFVIEDYK